MSNNENSDSIPQSPQDWDRCHVYMERKKRFCRQQRAAESSYCGNHQHLLSTTFNTTKRKRVPCPLDPSHFVYEDALEKHVLVCPKATKQKEQEKQFFYQFNMNSGGHGALTESNEPLDLIRAKRLAHRILAVHGQLFGGGTSFHGINEATDLLDLAEPEMRQGLSDAIAAHRIRSGGSRHVLQQASLLGHLRRIGALNLRSGGLIMAGASSGSGVQTDLILVERNVYPKDTAYPFDLKSVEWQRVQCDIAHVDLVSLINHSETNETQQANDDSTEIVVVAKHLCGVGSDLALKALYPIRSRVTACMFATCCHGVCSWGGYVGRDHLRQVFETQEMCFGENEFDLMRKWAGAVVVDQTKAEDDNGDENKHQTLVDDDEKAEQSTNVGITAVADGLECGTRGLGRACQRLIDYGRREYIHQVLGSDSSMNVEMIRYTPDSVSPQNTALIGYRKCMFSGSAGLKRDAASITASPVSDRR